MINLKQETKKKNLLFCNNKGISPLNPSKCFIYLQVSNFSHFCRFKKTAGSLKDKRLRFCSTPFSILQDFILIESITALKYPMLIVLTQAIQVFRALSICVKTQHTMLTKHSAVTGQKHWVVIHCRYNDFRSVTSGQQQILIGGSFSSLCLLQLRTSSSFIYMHTINSNSYHIWCPHSSSLKRLF